MKLTAALSPVLHTLKLQECISSHYVLVAVLEWRSAGILALASLSSQVSKNSEQQHGPSCVRMYTSIYSRAAAMTATLEEPEVALEGAPKQPVYLVQKAKARLTRTWDLACEHWFILAVLFAIGFAAALPNFARTGGWIRGEYTIKYGAVIVIFLLSGMSLKSRVLLQAATRLPLHISIQLICLGLTPLIGYALARAMRTAGDWLNQDLVTGLIICTSMPTTISTNVVFTKQAGGNEAIALINAVIGNVSGIFISPGLLVLYLGKSSSAPYAQVLKNLTYTVIAPLIVGQIIQYVLPKVVAWLQKHINFGKVSNVMIVLMVWNTFCNTFHAKVKANAGSLILIIFLCVALYIVFTLVCFGIVLLLGKPQIPAALRVSRSDGVAVMMCGATKTLALGIPLISVIYAGKPNAGLLSLPLIIYHASQILQGSMIVPTLKKWTAGDPALNPSTSVDSIDTADSTQCTIKIEQQGETVKGSSSQELVEQASGEPRSPGDASVGAPAQSQAALATGTHSSRQ